MHGIVHAQAHGIDHAQAHGIATRARVDYLPRGYTIGKHASRMGEHGVSWENIENTENMEKMENINQMT